MGIGRRPFFASSNDSVVKRMVRRLLMSLDPVFGGALSLLNGERGTVRAICLHGMKPTAAPSPGLPADAETDLESLRQMVELLLRRKYRFITPAQLSQGLDPRVAYFVLTFDDGYWSSSLAVNLMRQYGVPVTLFVCPHFMERQIAFWSESLYRGCEQRRVPQSDMLVAERRLRELPQTDREAWLVDQFGPECLTPLGDADRPLTSAELKQLWSFGNLEIGNHSWNHTALSRLSGPEIEAELGRVQRYVHALVGVSPGSMSFPYGFYNDATLDVVRQMGFSSAFTTVNRLHSTSSLRNAPFVTMGRFGGWNHKRPFERQVLRLRHGSLLSDRFLRMRGTASS